MDNTTVSENSTVKNSIIGENVNFKGTAESSKNIESIVKGKNIVVEKLGTIVGDNVKANNVTIKPGCKIWPNKEIKGEIKNDII